MRSTTSGLDLQSVGRSRSSPRGGAYGTRSESGRGESQYVDPAPEGQADEHLLIALWF